MYTMYGDGPNIVTKNTVSSSVSISISRHHDLFNSVTPRISFVFNLASALFITFAPVVNSICSSWSCWKPTCRLEKTRN